MCPLHFKGKWKVASVIAVWFILNPCISFSFTLKNSFRNYAINKPYSFFNKDTLKCVLIGPFDSGTILLSALFILLCHLYLFCKLDQQSQRYWLKCVFQQGFKGDLEQQQSPTEPYNKKTLKSLTLCSYKNKSLQMEIF